MPNKYIDNKTLVEENSDKWIKIFNKLGFIGFQKQALYESFDKEFGEDSWLPAHFFYGEVVSRLEGYKMYDEAYYEFLKDNQDIKEWIADTANEVMDYSESNLESGLDLSHQEGNATHIQDISVRRALTRLSLEDQGIKYDLDNLPVIPIFKGDHIVQIRDHTTEGFVLNPGQVPFHKPELGLDTYKKSWWKKDSAEDIYQRNKVLLVDFEELKLQLVIAKIKDQCSIG